jgi:hypothetical protein
LEIVSDNKKTKKNNEENNKSKTEKNITDNAE